MIRPRDLMDTALSRHRQPWNFTMQAFALPCIILALAFHSGLWLASAIIFIGVGFLVLPLPPMRPGRWRRMIDKAIALEVRLLNTPSNKKKIAKTTVFTLVLLLGAWALWAGELLWISFVVGLAAVYRAYVYNKSTGISA